MVQQQIGGNAILVLLAIIALALFVALGGDDATELEIHGQWMAETESRGTLVLW